MCGLQVSVLLVDEAHERSLNTDIVLGIARSVRKQRPSDFHVVVASATIDPARFIEFFGSSTSALKVPGKTYPVTVEYQPGEELVTAAVEALDKHPEGNLMAFLPGQREVDAAVRKFKVCNLHVCCKQKHLIETNFADNCISG